MGSPAPGSPATLGNLIRLAPLRMDEIPAHPQLPPSSRPGSQHVTSGPSTPYNSPDNSLDNPPDNPATMVPLKTTQDDSESGASARHRFDEYGRPLLEHFVIAVLDEAMTFIDDILPHRFKLISEKTSRPADSIVQLLKYEILGQTLGEIPWESYYLPRNPPKDVGETGEAWFARSSEHPDEPQKGTASFSEFESSLRDNHSEHEAEYTPAVFDARLVLDWTIPRPPGKNAPDFSHYRNVSMRIFEMGHKLPPPLSPRVFPVLVITADTGVSYGSDFVIVQIPVNIETLPEAFYSNGRNLREGEDGLRRKKPTLGVYTSIERCRLIDGHITWEMVTASDAKGWLPMWAQKKGVPGAVLKDVGLFMKWIEKKRKRARTSSDG
ncbi:MAG: hypothetical protein Q9212_005619 [Teloschistes hypoglaucus]